MPVKVVDASAVAAILFNEPDAKKILDQIADDSLLASPLLTIELTSVCLKKIRIRPRQRDLLLGSFQLLRRLEIAITPVDHLEVIMLAESTSLTIYDGCYLWLAREFHCELLTLDRKLAAALKN